MQQAKRNPLSRAQFREKLEAIRGNFHPDSSSMGLYQDILSLLRASQWLAWTSHWAAQGPQFYGDHKLLQRIYEKEGINDLIDGLGERMVTHFGPISIVPTLIQRKAREEILAAGGSNPFESLLTIEYRLQDKLKEAWQAEQKANKRSLGMDDWLMSTASSRETVIYLLRQRLGK